MSRKTRPASRQLRPNRPSAVLPLPRKNAHLPGHYRRLFRKACTVADLFKPCYVLACEIHNPLPL